MKSITTSRYKYLMVWQGFFLTLIVGVLAFNYYATRQSLAHADVIDNIGSLSDEFYGINVQAQRIKNAKTPEVRKVVIDEAMATRTAIDARLRVLENGDEQMGIDGEMRHVPPLTDEVELIHYKEVKLWWTRYKDKLIGVVNGDDAVVLNDFLYENRGLLAHGLEAIRTSQFDKVVFWNRIAKSVLIGGFLFAFLFLTWFLLVFLKRQALADEKIQLAHQQTAEILNTVNEGLFLIDRDLRVSGSYSKRLEEILNRTDIAGRTLIELLQGLISQEDLKITKMFIDQLYNPWVVSELIEDLNPLRQVRVSFLDEHGDAVVKFLSFSFLQVQDEDDEVNEVFVSVVDVTESVMLEQALTHEKSEHARQIDMMGYILTTDVAVLDEFIKNTNARIEEMNEILRTSGQLHNKAQALFRKIHSLKGEASAIKMTGFVDLANQGENQLDMIRKQNNVVGQDFLGFTMVLNELLDLTQFVEGLLDKLSHVVKVQAQKHEAQTHGVEEETSELTTTKAGEWERYFTNYTNQVANRYGKQVAISVVGFDEIPLGDKAKKFCKDVSVQLLNNAVLHGIEAPASREAIGKDETGRVVLSLGPQNGLMVLTIEDDGAGINLERIRQKAVQMGIMTAEDARVAPPAKLYMLMFHSGMSTAITVSEDAGRGVGMDIVRDWIRAINGKVNVESNRGKYTKISIGFNPQM